MRDDTKNGCVADYKTVGFFLKIGKAWRESLTPPYTALRLGEAPPKRGTFLRLRVYEREEISLAEMHKKSTENCQFGLSKGPKGLTDVF